jgi:hypothetical protein
MEVAHFKGKNKEKDSEFTALKSLVEPCIELLNRTTHQNIT